MFPVQIARLVVFVAGLVFACIVTGLCAFLVNGFTGLTETCYDYYTETEYNCGSVPIPSFLLYGLAVGAITLINIPTVMIIDRVRKHAYTSLLWVEMARVFVLSILWFAMAGLATPYTVFQNPFASSITAFSFLAAFLFLGWFIALLVFGIKGNHWTSYISDTDINAPKNNQAMTQKYNIDEDQKVQTPGYGYQVPQQAVSPAPTHATAVNPQGYNPYGNQQQMPQQHMQAPHTPGQGSIVV